MQEKSTMSLRELCAAVGVSRRAVQGYESHGLSAPTGKTKMGYLYYDAAAQARVQQIRQYQKYGFQISEVALLLDAPPDLLREKLEEKLAVLVHRQQETDGIIAELQRDIARLK